MSKLCKNVCGRSAEADRRECSSCRRARCSGSAAPVDREQRILLIDIETSPNLAYVWGLWDQSVGLNQLKETTEMICFAAKWLGERKTFFFSGHEHGREGMVIAAHDLLDKADVVMHFNGKAFDVKHLNREFVTAGLTPPAPFAQVDLLLEVRKNFKFPSNKLAYVSKALGLKGKVEHEGFDLWLKCMAGDVGAWKRMERYNRQDVVLLEELFHKLLPWLRLPNRNLYADVRVDDCPSCGSLDLQKRGFAYTRVSRFQQFRCQACGSYFRSSKRVDAVEMQQVVR